MNKDFKRRVLASVLALTVSAGATGCANNNVSDTNQEETNKEEINSIAVTKSYKINLGKEVIELNEEEYNELVSEILENEKFYNRDVEINDVSANVGIERTYNISLFGKMVSLSESEYDNLVAQLVVNGLTEEYNLDETNMEENSYEELTTENFENLVANFSKIYESANLPVTTKDITEFVSVANIDLLSEQNPELIRSLAGNQTREEYLNDAAKLIGAIVMNNFNVWNNTKSTNGFVRASDAIYGEQKEYMIKIEEYTNKIAEAVNRDDSVLVNMNSGSLSKLDDGVGFAAQVNIAVISDGIAKDYLDQENFDMFQVLKTSEKYVSNIFTEYEKCKTLSR